MSRAAASRTASLPVLSQNLQTGVTAEAVTARPAMKKAATLTWAASEGDTMSTRGSMKSTRARRSGLVRLE